MLNGRIKILKDKNENTLINYEKRKKRIENKYKNFSINDLDFLNIEEEKKEVIKGLIEIEKTEIKYFDPKQYGEFKIIKKGEIRYFKGKENDLIIEITTKKPMLLDGNNFIKNIDLGFVSNVEFKEDIEQKITLELLKRNKKKLNNIFIENATLNEGEDNNKIFQQKLITFLNEKDNLEYNIRNILLNNWKKIQTHLYGFYEVFYQNLFLKNGNNFYPISVFFKSDNGINFVEGYEIIGEPIIVNNLFHILEEKGGLIYKENDYMGKKDFYNINKILKGF